MAKKKKETVKSEKITKTASKKEVSYKKLKYETTKDIKVSKTIIDQVIGQEHAVRIVKKAALQRRHVLLIGEPGTGKSMLGLALSELLPKEKLMDTVSFPNPNDENKPLIRTMPAGKAREYVMQAKLKSMSSSKNYTYLFIILILISSIYPYWLWKSNQISDVVYSAYMIIGIISLFGFFITLNFTKKMENKGQVPKVIVDNFDNKRAPFYDATGAHAGALLGDVLHDPFQSGGLGTPAHERVVAGMIHKAHMGVLFVDEIATLEPRTQQDLLTSLQEGKYPITGQSERSAGAMVRTEPVPCTYVMIAAGNLETVAHMHPALRSRLRGYGYEVFMSETMVDTPENINPSPTPGNFVRHPDCPEWGLGQVQSVIGDRITVNFEHAGKQLILGNIITLLSDTPAK